MLRMTTKIGHMHIEDPERRMEYGEREMNVSITIECVRLPGWSVFRQDQRWAHSLSSIGLQRALNVHPIRDRGWQAVRTSMQPDFVCSVFLAANERVLTVGEEGVLGCTKERKATFRRTAATSEENEVLLGVG